MSIVLSPDGLPPKILRHIEGQYFQDFIAAFKTNIKPNDTIPILWIILYKNGLLFCNTHKTRGLFRDIKIHEIDSFKIMTSDYAPPIIKIIFKDMNNEDLHVESPKGTKPKELVCILGELGVQLLDG